MAMNARRARYPFVSWKSVPASFLVVLLSACASAPPPEPPPAPVAQPEVTPQTESVIGVVRVKASSLNIRREPSASAEIIDQVQRGTRLSLLASGDEWMKIRLDDGRTGWVARRHVEREGAATATRRSRRSGCPADSEYRFAKAPVPAFSDRGAHGLVVVEANVDAQGNVGSTRVISNETGDEALGLLAEREIKSAKFVAPVRDCVARSFIFTYKRAF